MASVQSVHAAGSEPSAAPKPTEARKSAPVEFSTSRERVGGREIAGFSAQQAQMAQEQNLTTGKKQVSGFDDARTSERDLAHR
jgi:hypothetical protein